MSTYLQRGVSKAKSIKSYYGDEREEFIKKHLDEIELGNPSAMNSLANYYNYGEKNYEMAKKYYEMAVELKYPNAIIAYGDYYMDIENNVTEAIRIFKIGIDNLNTVCMTRLANYYRGIENYEEMEKYYLMAYNHGNNFGIHQLGIYYKYEKKDYSKMIECFNKGIQKECDECAYGMGVYYEDIENNYDLMKDYYTLAIQKNNTRAMFALGYYYERIEKNQELANTYFEMGVELNNEQCILGLAIYYKSICDIDNMIKYYEKLVQFNNSEAMYELSRYYLVKKNNTDLAMNFAQNANRFGYDTKQIQKLIQAILLKKNVNENKNAYEPIEFNLEPDVEESKNKFQKGIELLCTNKFEEAKEMLIQSVKLGNPDGLYYLGKKYYLEKKFNSTMFKYCLEYAIKKYTHKDSIKALLEYYTYTEYNKHYAIKYFGMLFGPNSLISIKDMTFNPYMYDLEDSYNNYMMDSDNNFYQINTESGERKQIIFDDI